MLVFIQQRHTRKLLTKSLDWDDEEANARNFDSSVQAIQWAQENNLLDVDVVIRMDWGDDSALRKIMEQLMDGHQLPPIPVTNKSHESQ